MASGSDAAGERLDEIAPGNSEGNHGQDGIAMAGWECYDLTTLALDQVAFIDAVVQLIEQHKTGNDLASMAVIKGRARWGSTA